jgi:hypothetical protein
MSGNWIGVQNALGRWAWGYDESNLATFLDAVTADARVTIETEDGSIRTLEGREAISSFYGGRLAVRPVGIPRRHVTTPVTIEEGEHEMTVLSYLSLYTFLDGSPEVVTTGWYRDRIVDEGDAWRIAERHIHLDVVDLPKP